MIPLRKLTARNFKCLIDDEVTFGNLTLFAGGNSVGKSSTLQILALLRQSMIGDSVGGDKAQLVLNGDLVTLGRGWDVFSSDAEEGGIAFALSWRDETKAQWSFSYEENARVLDGCGSDMPRQGRAPFQTGFSYLQADRHPPQRAYEIPRGRSAMSMLGPRGEFAAYYLAVHGWDEVDESSVNHPSAKTRRIRDQVEAWLGALCRPIRIVVEEHPSLDLVQMSFQTYRGRELGPSYRPNNVGFGLTYSLPVVLSLVASRPGDMVVVENPEAHLHPAAQVIMGDLCARAAASGVQVVVETHSDHILNGIRRAAKNRLVQPEDVALNYLRVTGDRIERISPRLDANGRLDQWPDGFFDQWDKILGDLLSV